MRRNADEVVRDTGWVFNNQTGASLTLEEFVQTGDAEVDVYLDRLGWNSFASGATMLEIGSGIGRMTSAFSRKFAVTVATDVDAAFLERCRETVFRFGRVGSLRTVHIADGSTVSVDDSSIDAVFSYITLQHCKASDALGLTSEAFRIVKPGGYVALNYRTWVPADWVLLPAGVVMRQLWRIPVVGPRVSQWRWSTRFGWQANRLDPKRVLSMLEASGIALDEVAILHHPGKPQKPVSYKGTTVAQRDLDVANKSHWWLVARSH
jgi:ubiquinone/menaquinone biosynthesis C-methylase UbiE